MKERGHQTRWPRAGPRTPLSRSGSRHLAGGTVGPVAIEPDHAPLDPPAGADHAGVLGDAVVDRLLAAVRGLDDTAAEAARNAVGGPRPKGGLAQPLEIHDLEIGIPVLVFLLIEPRGDAAERLRVVAGRQDALV